MSKRELIDTGTDKRYVRRDKQGSSSSPPMWADPCLRTSATNPRPTRSRARVIAAIIKRNTKMWVS